MLRFVEIVFDQLLIVEKGDGLRASHELHLWAERAELNILTGARYVLR